jgi:hypothetical protein
VSGVAKRFGECEGGVEEMERSNSALMVVKLVRIPDRCQSWKAGGRGEENGCVIPGSPGTTATVGTAVAPDALADNEVQ